MAAFDYTEAAQLAIDMITEFGRAVTLYKLSSTDADPAKPWRGAAVPTKQNAVATYGAFVIPNTSIPTESRGLAFDWIDAELLKRVREVCLTPAQGLSDLEDYKVMTDGTTDYKILWGQCFKPGQTRLFYVFGVSK